MEANPNQHAQQLSSIHRLLNSPLFTRDSPADAPWQAAFAELISQTNQLLLGAKQAGKAVEFYEGVGVHGKNQDITSLVSWFQAEISNLSPQAVAADARLSRYFDRGTGYFADGTFFTAEYDHEVAFFLNNHRIYLHHHIGRAVDEAARNLNVAS